MPKNNTQKNKLYYIDLYGTLLFVHWRVCSFSFIIPQTQLQIHKDKYIEEIVMEWHVTRNRQ